MFDGRNEPKYNAMKNIMILGKFFKKFTQLKRAGILFLILLALTTVKPASVFAQTGLPGGSCGIEYIYDAAGNMVERHYICNNVIPRKASPTTVEINQEALNLEKKSNINIEMVDVLYPNPTTGQFRIKMTKELKNSQVYVLDVNNKVVLHKSFNGFQVELNLSGKPSGVYIVNIIDEGETLTFKLVKK